MLFVVVGEYLHVCVCVCAEKQVKMWDPLLDWFKSEIGVRPLVTSSIFGTTQPPEVLDAVEKAIRECSDWQLAAVDWLAGTARSLIVALAIARGRLGIEEAIEIIRLEEDHQVEDWGYVEGGHDIDEADIRVKISSCSVFLRLL
jgi:ATP synthase F1 complex assembly factor 2